LLQHLQIVVEQALYDEEEHQRKGLLRARPNFKDALHPVASLDLPSSFVFLRNARDGTLERAKIDVRGGEQELGSSFQPPS
jgi:hypothetical protein